MEEQTQINEVPASLSKGTARRYSDHNFDPVRILCYGVIFDYPMQERIKYLAWVRPRLEDLIKELEYTMRGSPERADQRAPQRLARVGHRTYAQAFGVHKKTLRAIDDHIAEYQFELESQQLEHDQKPTSELKINVLKAAERLGEEPRKAQQQDRLVPSRLAKEAACSRRTLKRLLEAEPEFRQELDRAFDKGRQKSKQQIDP